MTHQPPHAITPLESLEELDAAIARSAETPVLLFKHGVPQVLLLQDGVVRWHRSHASVTAEAIARALQHARPETDEAL